MITITMKTYNAAFEDYAAEVARILRDLADRYERDQTHLDGATLRDLNGNTVGKVHDDGEED